MYTEPRYTQAVLPISSAKNQNFVDTQNLITAYTCVDSGHPEPLNRRLSEMGPASMNLTLHFHILILQSLDLEDLRRKENQSLRLRSFLSPSSCHINMKNIHGKAQIS